MAKLGESVQEWVELMLNLRVRPLLSESLASAVDLSSKSPRVAARKRRLRFTGEDELAEIRGLGCQRSRRFHLVMKVSCAQPLLRAPGQPEQDRPSQDDSISQSTQKFSFAPN